MALNDRMVLTLRAHLTGQPVGLNDFNNTFAYEVVSGTGDTQDLGNSFATGVYAAIRAVTSNQVLYDDTYTVNLDNPIDFDINLLGTQGSIGGDYLPLYVAWGFRYARTTRVSNDGAKRFAGVAENDQVNGIPTSSALVLLGTLAGLLNTQITGANGSYAPRIWRRAGNYGSPPVAFPDTFYPVSGVTFRSLTTQNTRKR